MTNRHTRQICKLVESSANRRSDFQIQEHEVRKHFQSVQAMDRRTIEILKNTTESDHVYVIYLTVRGMAPQSNIQGETK